MNSKQEIFDRVVSHLLTQGAKSMGPGALGYQNRCAYRGAYGRMCAVGCLISDEFYNPDLEGRSVNHFMVLDALEKSGVENAGAHSFILSDLQLTHDSHDVKQWREELRKLAFHHKLEWNHGE